MAKNIKLALSKKMSIQRMTSLEILMMEKIHGQ